MSPFKWLSLRIPRYSILGMRAASAAQADETADQFKRMREYMFKHYEGQPDHFANMCIRSGYEVVSRGGPGILVNTLVETPGGGTVEQ